MSDRPQCLPASEDFGVLPKYKEVCAYKKAHKPDIDPILQWQIQLGGALLDEANIEVKESSWASLPTESAVYGSRLYEACHLKHAYPSLNQIPVYLRSYEKDLDLGLIPFWSSATEYPRLVNILGKTVPDSLFAGLKDNLGTERQLYYQFSFPGLTFPLRKLEIRDGDVVEALSDMAGVILEYFAPGNLNRRLQEIQSIRYRDDWPIENINGSKIRLIGLHYRRVNHGVNDRITGIYTPILALDP